MEAYPDPRSPWLAVIGAGPAGLRAAEVAVAAGVRVTVFDAQPSVGRKFLVAGSGGLNLTKSVPGERFAAQYLGGPAGFWAERIAEFGPEDLRAWAADLGVETFAATTGRVYPRSMKGAPLLRAWVRRLRERGVTFAVRHRWSGFAAEGLRFATPSGERLVTPTATVLALGGGSWPETGSDAAWIAPLAAVGVRVEPLAAANCGWEADWPEAVRAWAGTPLKNLAVTAGAQRAAGELLLTDYGLEGGVIYAVGAALRAMAEPEMRVDFKPAVEAATLVRRFGAVPRGRVEAELAVEAARRWRLGPAVAALLAASGGGDVAGLAVRVKNFPVRLRGPRPLAEAISSAGGVAWDEVDAGTLMLRRQPGVFLAGEMLDWEAPTGGYLLHGCFVTGALAGAAAARYVLGS